MPLHPWPPAFGGADWLKLDLVSLPALIAVLSSLRFDSRAIDVAALLSVAVFVVRALLAYRNSIVRYELLLNRFLKEKVAMRERSEIVACVAREARCQRARRAAALLAHMRTLPHALTAQAVCEGFADHLTGGEPGLGEAPHAATGSGSASERRMALDIAALDDLRRLGLVQTVPGGHNAHGSASDCDSRAGDGSAARGSAAQLDAVAPASSGGLTETRDESVDDGTVPTDELVVVAMDGEQRLQEYWAQLLGFPDPPA